MKKKKNKLKDIIRPRARVVEEMWLCCKAKSFTDEKKQQSKNSCRAFCYKPKMREDI